MNYNDRAVAYHVERAKQLQKRNERRADILTACGIIAAVAVAAVLVAGAGKVEREYSEDVVIVRSGDTLWNIADAYCPDDMDKRDYIRAIEVDNDCTSAIKAGDVLTVRVYKK